MLYISILVIKTDSNDGQTLIFLVVGYISKSFMNLEMFMLWFGKG